LGQKRGTKIWWHKQHAIDTSRSKGKRQMGGDEEGTKEDGGSYGEESRDTQLIHR
jgi:hypothetical protein